MQTITFIIIILLALTESWFQPWLAVAGVAVPLTLSGLVLLQAKVSSQLLPWLGLAAGVAIDLSSVNYFGINTLYYLLTAWLVTQVLTNANQRKKLWVRVGIISLAGLIQPWYLILANRQFETDLWYSLWVSLIRFGCVGVLALVFAWFLSRKEESGI